MNPLLQMLGYMPGADQPPQGRQFFNAPGQGLIPIGPDGQPIQAPEGVPPAAALDPNTWKAFGGPPPSATPAAPPGPALGQFNTTPAPAAAPAVPPAVPPGTFRPTALGEDGGGGRGPGAYTPTGEKGAYAPPTQAPAPAANPFEPQFVNTSGVNGVTNGRTVYGPDERLAAMAEQVANRTSANLLGTGFHGNQPLGMDSILAAGGLGQDAAKQFMLGGLQGQKEQFEGGQNQADRQLKALLGDQTAGFHRDVADITGKAHVDAARIGAAAHSNPAAIKGQVLGQMLPALFMNPNMDPKMVQTALGAIDQMNLGAAGQHGGGGDQPLSVAKGDGTGPAPAAADPLAAIGAANRATQLLHTLAPLLGKGAPVAGQFQQGDVSPAVAAQVLQKIHAAGLSDAEREGFVGDIRAGRLGDPSKIRDAIAIATAGSYLRLQPPVDPKSGKPIAIDPLRANPLTANPQFPGLYDIPGQFKLQVDPKAVSMGGGGLLGGGIPYNQIVLPKGATVRTNANQLRSVGRRNAFEGLSPEELKILAGVGGQLLPGLAK